MMRSSVGMLVALLAAVAAPLGARRALGGEAIFAGSPSVKRAGGGFAISFRVKRPVDVTVRIVDGRGSVIRHLACGMVGMARAAKPLAAKSLSQTVTWDGKDDGGKSVSSAGCKVLVAAGLKAKFDRFILGNSEGFIMSGYSSRVVRGPNDEHFVFQHAGRQLDTVRVFSKEGKFLRCAYPHGTRGAGYKAFLASERGADDWNGNRVPLRVNHNQMLTDFGPRFTQGIISTDGFMVGIQGYSGGIPAIPLLHRATAEGYPDAGAWAAPWHPRRAPQDTPKEKARLWRGRGRPLWKLAAGRDGDFYICDGIHNVVARFRAGDFEPVDFTYSGTKKLGRPRPYIGELDSPGDDEGRFKGPDGVAVAKDGRILVLDGEVVKTYDETGRFLERKPKAQSDYGRVFDPLRDGGAGWYGMSRAKPPFGGVSAPVVAASKAAGTLAFPHVLRVGSKGRLYVRNRSSLQKRAYIISDTEGKALKTISLPWQHTSASGYMCTDAAGNFYIGMSPNTKKPNELWKYSPDGKRAKFGAKDAIAAGYGNRGSIRGVYVTRSGDIYLAVGLDRREWPKETRKYGKFVKGDRFNVNRVDVYSADGSLKKKDLLRCQDINDVAIDRDGNVYVINAPMWEDDQAAHAAYEGEAAKSKGWPPPHLRPEQARLDPKTESHKRLSVQARLVKFAPDGGSLDVEGKKQLWDFAGISGTIPSYQSSDAGAQICLDADERLWVPDSFMYCIRAVDKAGNLIANIGVYGNEDCKGGGGDKRLPGTKIIVDPEIPLARPQGAAVFEDRLFISDMSAHRVMRCKLEFADREEAPLR